MNKIFSSLILMSVMAFLPSIYSFATDLQKEIIEPYPQDQSTIFSTHLYGASATEFLDIMEGRFKNCSEKQSLEMLESGKRLQKENKHTQALKKFIRTAQYGSSEAMYLAGISLAEKGEQLEAIRWYFIAFYNQLFDNLRDYAEARQAIIKSAPQSAIFDNYYKLIAHSKKTVIKSINTYKSMHHYLNNHFVEEYFSNAEIRLLRYRTLNKLFSCYVDLNNPNLKSSADKDKELLVEFAWHYHTFRPDLEQLELNKRIREVLLKVDTIESKVRLGAMYAANKLMIDENNNVLSKDERLKKAFILIKEGKSTLSGRCYLGELYASNELPNFKKRKLSKQARFTKAFNYLQGLEFGVAFTTLGNLYLNNELPERVSKKLTTDQRLNIAKSYFIKADSPDSKHLLGSMYFSSTLPEEELKALNENERFKRALELCQEAETPKAFELLARMFLWRRLPNHILAENNNEQLCEQAYHYIKKAGTEDSIAILGIMYENLLVPQHEKEKFIGKNDHLIKAKEVYESAYTPLGYLHLAELVLNHPTLFFETKKEAYETAYIYAVQAKAIFSKAKDLITKIELCLAEENISHNKDQVRKQKSLLTLEANEANKPVFSDNISSAENITINLEENYSNLDITKPPLIKNKALNSVELVKNQIILEKLKTIPDQQRMKDFRIVYAVGVSEKEFKEECEVNKKLSALMDDIILRPWELRGEGQPEVLRHKVLIKGKSYKGCFSRRLNAVDRLIYKVKEDKIIILSWKGHYE